MLVSKAFGGGYSSLGSLPQSFSGQDFTIWAYLPGINKTEEESQPVVFANIQTITTSYAQSVSPVIAIGTDVIGDLVSGSKTFAGSIIFSLLDVDPLRQFINLELAKDRKPGNEFFTIDQLPAFNIVIQGSNEYLKRAAPGKRTRGKVDLYKVIVGVKLVTYGETISIDDFFTEQSYQYQARFISPWKEGSPEDPFDLLPSINIHDKLVLEDLPIPSPLLNAGHAQNSQAEAALKELQNEVKILDNINTRIVHNSTK